MFWGHAAERGRSQFPGQGWNPRPWQEKPGVLAPGGRAVPAEGPPGARTGLLGAAEAGTRHLHTGADLARPPAGLGARGRPERLFPGPRLAAAALGGPRACPGRREEGGVVGDWGRCPRPSLPPPAPAAASRFISGRQRASLRSYLIPGAPQEGAPERRRLGAGRRGWSGGRPIKGAPGAQRAGERTRGGTGTGPGHREPRGLGWSLAGAGQCQPLLPSLVGLESLFRGRESAGGEPPCGRGAPPGTCSSRARAARGAEGAEARPPRPARSPGCEV